jgi:hypothetical protein
MRKTNVFSGEAMIENLSKSIEENRRNSIGDDGVEIEECRYAVGNFWRDVGDAEARVELCS